MSDTPEHDMLRDLDAVLDAERDALLGGELEMIEGLVQRKSELVERLTGLPRLPDGAIVPLQQKMRRNQVLLDSALDGIRAVAIRMAELRSLRRSLETYDRNGRRQSLSTPQDSTVERRA